MSPIAQIRGGSSMVLWAWPFVVLAAAGVLVLVFGRGKARGEFVDVREAAAESVRRGAAGAGSAWVFGPESRGLSTDEIGLCTHRVTLPTLAAQPSLNLAQAVAVCAYETARATETDAPRALPRTAPWEERDHLYRQWETGLLAISQHARH